MGFGVVSLAADMVYEGARSITGPLLASLGASALLVGVVTGGGEALALVLRVVAGPLADRSGRYWTLTLAGYGLMAVCVPLLAVTPFVGAAGLGVACGLVLAERAGKAIRSPAKTALLAEAASLVGHGRGFAVHKALDQVGAFAGPLLVAGVVAATGAIWPGLALLAVPGVAAMVLLLWIRARFAALPDGGARRARTADGTPATRIDDPRKRLPRIFYLFAASAGAATAGLVTFGVISFHLIDAKLLPVAAVPLVYAAGMAAEAPAALATGFLYDRWGAKVLLALPFLVAAVPALAFSLSATTVVIGVLIWGAANGIQDSTVKALVADLVPSPRRATAYGVFAAIQGAAALAGGALAGALYGRVPLLVGTIAGTQVVALVLLVVTLRTRAPAADS